MRLSTLLLWACLPVFNTLNQVAMKFAALSLSDQTFGFEWLLQAIRCPYIWMSLACEVVNFVVWLAILKRHSLSRAFPMTSISYAALMLASWLIFRETLHLQQLIGTAIIVVGIVLLAKEEKA